MSNHDIARDTDRDTEGTPVTAAEDDPSLQSLGEQAGEVGEPVHGDDSDVPLAPAGEDDEPTDLDGPLNPA